MKKIIVLFSKEILSDFYNLVLNFLKVKSNRNNN